MFSWGCFLNHAVHFQGYAKIRVVLVAGILLQKLNQFFKSALAEENNLYSKQILFFVVLQDKS